MTKQKSHYRELLARRAKLDQEIEVARRHEAKDAIKTCLALIEEFELTTVDLGFVKPQHVPAKKVAKSEKTFAAKSPKRVYPPKYVDPATGHTWSGMGHQPRWIVGNRDDYLIKTEAKPLIKRVTQNNKHEQE